MKNQNSNTRVGNRLRQLIAGVTAPHVDLPGTHKEFEGTKKQLLDYLGAAKPASDIDALYFSALRLVASVEPKGVVTKKGKATFLQEVSNHLAFVIAFVGTHCEDEVNRLMDLFVADPPVKYEDLELGFAADKLVEVAQHAVAQFCQPYKQLLDLKANNVPGIDAPLKEVQERYDAFVAQQAFELAGEQALVIVVDDEGEGEATQNVADMVRSDLQANIIEQCQAVGDSAVIPGAKGPETAKPKVAKQAAAAEPTVAPSAEEPAPPAVEPEVPVAEAPVEETAPAPVNPAPAAAAPAVEATPEAPAPAPTAPAPVQPTSGDTPVSSGIPSPVAPVPTAPAPQAPAPQGGPATA